MTNGSLNDNGGIFTFLLLNNSIILNTEDTFVGSNITLNTKVVKAVLTTDTATNVFDIQVPNGASTVTFTFAVDASGNVLVT